MSGSIGGIDASIPLRAGQGVPPPANPLATIGQFATVKNALNQNEIGQQTIKANNMSLAQQQKQLFYAHIAPAVAQGRIKTLADLTNFAAGLEAYHGIVSQPFVDDVTRTTAQGGDFIKNLQMQTTAGMQSPENVGRAIFPGRENVDQGLVRQGFNVNPPGTPDAGVQTPVGAPIPLGASPSQQGQLVTYTTSDHVEHTEPWAKFNHDHGNGLVLGPGRFPDGSVATPGGGAPSTTPNGQPRLPVPNGAAPGGSGMTGVSGPALGTKEDALAFKNAQLGLPDAYRRVQSLQEAKGALEQVVAGRGSGSLNAMKSYLNTGARALWLNSIGVDPYSVATMNYDIMKKYLTDYARQAVNGTGTNMAREQATESNPNPEINPDASLHIVKTNIGRERQSIAQVLEAPHPAGIGYGAHASTFAGNTDPIAFALDEFSPAERARIMEARKTMPPAQRARFDKSLEIAAKRKLINVPGAQ